jgi:hypothetical protein
MSRILRRPMFRGGVTNNEGIMSVPRKRYAESDEVGVQPESDSFTDLSKLTSREMMETYLGQRPDPLGKFLINFGLNYMSATPKGGKFGALATAAESAKKPTEQLYSDIDTDRVLKLKLMTAFGKEKTSDLMKKAQAYAKETGGTVQQYLAKLAQQAIDDKATGVLKDLSPEAIIRMYGEEAAKKGSYRDDPLAQRNIGIFRLRLEQGKINPQILNNLAPGNPYLEGDLITRSSTNKNILEFSPNAKSGDKAIYSPAYIYINPTDRGFYQIKEIDKKQVFVKISEYN